MRALCIIKSMNLQILCDSDIYSDFYTYEMPEDTEKMVTELTDIIETLKDSDIRDVLFVLNNNLYFLMSKIMKIICPEKQLRMFIIPEYKITWLNKAYLVEDIYYEVDYQKPRLPQYQVHLTDMCNLNCKGCGHFCNIAKTPKLLNIEEYEQDIIKIKEKFWGVRWIYLLGGEPLLHKQAYEFIKVTRKIFPDADIRFTTNGLLLPNMSEEFWHAVRTCHIHIEISQYKKTREKWKEIQNALVSNDVADSTLVQTYKGKFFKQRVLEPQANLEEAYTNCMSHECHYLRDGKLYLCPCVPLNQIFYEHFNLKMPYEPEGIDLYGESIDGWKMMEFLAKPNEACRYCTSNHEWYDWDVRQKQDVDIVDWIIV